MNYKYSVKCAGQFQAAKINPSRDGLRSEGRATQKNGDESDKERNGKNRTRPNGKDDEEHIISPASYVTHSTCVNSYLSVITGCLHRRDRRDKASGSKQNVPGEHDGTQFFRRIHLMYLNDDDIIMYVAFFFPHSNLVVVI